MYFEGNIDVSPIYFSNYFKFFRKNLYKFLYKLLRFSYKPSSNFHKNFISQQNFSYNDSKTLENYSTVASLFSKISPE